MQVPNIEKNALEMNVKTKIQTWIYKILLMCNCLHDYYIFEALKKLEKVAILRKADNQR